MFRIVSFLLAILSAAAFAPAARMSSRSALKMAFENELGAQPPLGFYDPLGFLKFADAETFQKYRDAELKHGRVSMLAVLGHIVTTAGVRLPGDIAFGTPFASIDTGLAALYGPHAVPQQGLVQLIIFLGAVDLGFTYAKDEIERVHLGKLAERVGADKVDSKRAIELNNGRAAMMGIFGLVVHELINNDPYVINSLLGAPVPFNA
jgi:hypothetical protein